jgi:hypothetical protein
VERLNDSRVIFRSPEVDTLAALKGRSGSTLLPKLRDAWMGDTLGFAYASQEKAVTLEPQSYRLGLVVGIQPERARPLFEDAEGGTPQRFLWMPSTDPLAPDRKPPRLASRAWKSPIGPAPRTEIPVCALAAEEIDRAAVARTRGEVHALDGHAMLCRLKVAAGLAILSERLRVDDDDWLLAGLVMQKSDETRAIVQRALSVVEDRKVEARARAQAKVHTTVAEAEEQRAIVVVANRILARLEAGEWTPRGTIRNRCSKKDRVLYEEALDHLVASGLVELVVDEYHGQPRARYRKGC